MVFFPGAITVAKVDAAAERGVAGAPKDVDGAGAGVAEVFLLEGDEGFCGGAIVLGDFKAKAVGVVLELTGKEIKEGGEKELVEGNDDEKKGEGGDLIEVEEAKVRFVFV